MNLTNAWLQIGGPLCALCMAGPLAAMPAANSTLAYPSPSDGTSEKVTTWALRAPVTTVNPQLAWPIRGLEAPGHGEGAASGPSIAQASDPAAVLPGCPPAESDTTLVEAEARYRLALYLVSQQRYAQARDILESIGTGDPASPWTAQAQARLSELNLVLQAHAGDGSAGAPDPALGSSRPLRLEVPNSGRAEFVVAETLFGAYVGLSLPIMLELEAGPGAALALVGTFGGLGASLLYTSMNPISAQDAGVLYYSQLFTGINFVSWTLAIGGDNVSTKAPFVASYVGLMAGTVAGGLLAQQYDIDGGRVSTIASAGIWAPLLTETLLIATFGDSIHWRAYAVLAPLSSDVALAITTAATSHPDFRISRSRMRLINLGGVVGALTGGALSIMLNLEGKAVAYVVAGGAMAGLGTGIASTQNWDKSYHPELFSAVPTNSFLALRDGSLRFGTPSPTITTASLVVEERNELDERVFVEKRIPRVNVSLISGSF